MAVLPVVLTNNPGARQLHGAGQVELLRRVVEGLARSHSHRNIIYIGRPDPAQARVDFPHEAALLRGVSRAVAVTPDTTPIPGGTERRDPGNGWLNGLWFTAVLGPEAAMAVITDAPFGQAEQGLLLTGRDAVLRFVQAVEAEVSRPDPMLLAV
jgi:hypothetical protein